MKYRIQFSLLTIVLVGLIFSSCDKNEAELKIRELRGDWTWTASCGGFSGACSYPDNENYKSIQITNDKFTERANGIVTIDISYEITNTRISETNYPYEVDYELTLEDGSIIEMTLFKKLNKLAIGNNMFIDYYEGQ